VPTRRRPDIARRAAALAAVYACLAAAAVGAETNLVIGPDTHDRAVTRFTADQIAAWEAKTLARRPCRISPVIHFGPGVEINHHRLAVSYAGRGRVAAYVVSHPSSSREAALKRPPRLRRVENRTEMAFATPSRGASYAWVLLETTPGVRIAGITHTCWRGKGTLYGHHAGTFRFASATLPFRLMYPRNYYPKKAYRLVLSVSGSGGVGSDNVRSMEAVILARYLFTRYYHEKEFECFSLVPQIPSDKTIPAPYYPRGPKGAPTRPYHPDWAAVNEGSWYTDATLALIGRLVADKRLNIDPDRVYYTGFSYGGKACWEFLRAGRTVFAGAICGAGWPIGRAYANPSEPMLQRLRLEIKRHRHIPVWIFAGQKDPMRFGSRAVFKELRAAGAKVQYTELPGATHVGSAGGTWANRKHVRWLFVQTRKNTPPAGKDPYPGGKYPS